MSDILDMGPKKDKEAEKRLREQERQEKLRLQEEKDATARGKMGASKGVAGRGSLIATTATGKAKNLGGGA